MRGGGSNIARVNLSLTLSLSLGKRGMEDTCGEENFQAKLNNVFWHGMPRLTELMVVGNLDCTANVKGPCACPKA